MKNSANNDETLTGHAEGNAVGSRVSLTEREQGVVVGLLLGDGHLESTGHERARLCVYQHLKRRAYVDWLYEQLSQFVQTAPKMVMNYDRRTLVATPRYGFRTLTYPVFAEWHTRFYLNGKKQIPQEIDQWLDDVALAVWFADDGSFKTDSRGLLLNTNAFSEEDQQRLQEVLMRRFSIETSLHRLRQWKRIYVPARHTDRFIEIILPYLSKDLLYKLALTPERLIPYGRDRRIRLPRYR
jgi:hypothetical protein